MYTETISTWLMPMIDEIYFDTDCLSAFLWTRTEYLLNRLYPERITIPYQVYLELSHPNIPQLKARIDTLIQNGEARLIKLDIESKEEEMYLNLTSGSLNGRCWIGKGEAASISLAYYRNGVLASNNMRDVSYYIEKLGLKSMTTASILLEVFRKNILTEAEVNLIWSQMIAKRQKLPCNTFTEYMIDRESNQGKFK